jgi:hypothetical protein
MIPRTYLPPPLITSLYVIIAPSDHHPERNPIERYTLDYETIKLQLLRMHGFLAQVLALFQLRIFLHLPCKIDAFVLSNL